MRDRQGAHCPQATCCCRYRLGTRGSCRVQPPSTQYWVATLTQLITDLDQNGRHPARPGATRRPQAGTEISTRSQERTSRRTRQRQMHERGNATSLPPTAPSGGRRPRPLPRRGSNATPHGLRARTLVRAGLALVAVVETLHTATIRRHTPACKNRSPARPARLKDLKERANPRSKRPLHGDAWPARLKTLTEPGKPGLKSVGQVKQEYLVQTARPRYRAHTREADASPTPKAMASRPARHPHQIAPGSPETPSCTRMVPEGLEIDPGRS